MCKKTLVKIKKKKKSTHAHLKIRFMSYLQTMVTCLVFSKSEMFNY